MSNSGSLKRLDELCGSMRVAQKRNVENNMVGDSPVEEVPERSGGKKIVRRPQMSRETLRHMSVMKREKDFLKTVLSIDRKLGFGRDIHNEVQEALNYIDTRNKYWLRDIPWHILEKSSRLESRMSQAHSSAAKSKDQPSLTSYAIGQLARINHALATKRYQEAVDGGKALLKTLADAGEEEVEHSVNIVCNICSVMGNAELELGNNDKALAFHMQDLELASTSDLPEAKSRAIDNVGRVYARMGEYEKAIAVLLEKLAMPMEESERAWLCHEIGYCYLELDHFEEAKSYAEITTDSGKRDDNLKWQLNGCVLLAQAYLRSGDLVQSFEAFQQGLDLSVLQDDKASEDRIREAMEELNSVMVETLLIERLAIRTPPRPEETKSSGQQSGEGEDADEQALSRQETNTVSHENSNISGRNSDINEDKNGRRTSTDTQTKKTGQGKTVTRQNSIDVHSDNSATQPCSKTNQSVTKQKRKHSDGTTMTKKKYSVVSSMDGSTMRERWDTLRKNTGRDVLEEVRKFEKEVVERKQGPLKGDRLKDGVTRETVEILKPPRYIARVPLKKAPEDLILRRKFLEKELWRISLK